MFLFIACLACFLGGMVVEGKFNALISKDAAALKAEVTTLIAEVRGMKTPAPAATPPLPQPDRPAGT